MRSCVVNTHPGASLFAAPAGVDDYEAWLMAEYSTRRSKDGGRTVFFGVAQQMNAIFYAAQVGGRRVYAAGPQAQAVARVFSALTHGAVVVEVVE